MRKHVNIIITIICALICIAILTVSSGYAENYSSKEELRIIEDSVRTAVVRCYATEGRYPKTVDYLKNNYSLTVDEDRYFIIYEPQGGNIMPVIWVIEANDEK